MAVEGAGVFLDAGKPFGKSLLLSGVGKVIDSYDGMIKALLGIPADPAAKVQWLKVPFLH